MTTTIRFALATAFALSIVSGPGWAAESDEKEGAELAHALKGVKVSLQQGIAASAHRGKPISAKFEIEDGKLQLSVYTEKRGVFSEVLVDPKTGRVAKVEKIEEGEDLAAAKAQGDAMEKAKRTLGAAADAAVKENAGFRAASATPSLKDGHPVADVTLIKGDEVKTATEKLG